MKQLFAGLILLTSAFAVRGGYVVLPAVPQSPAETSVGPLGELVAVESRPQLAAFYGALAQLVQEGHCPTTGEFRAAQQLAVKVLQHDGRLPSLAPVNAPIEQRLVAAVGGLEDVPLDAAKRAALAAALAKIATDF